MLTDGASAPVSRGTPPLGERLKELARLRSPGSPVFSVYLNTRWSDEHQREHVRRFLERELRHAREGHVDRDLLDDLAWVEAEGGRAIRSPDAQGVALFACRPLGLREPLPVRVPFHDQFFSAERPVLAPLAELLEEAPPTLMVFVDGTSARLTAFLADGRGGDVTIEHEVEGRHRQGGWALLAQSRYQRHIEHHRGHHFQTVAEALGRFVPEWGIERIVLVGELRAVALLRHRLPSSVAARVIGVMHGARHESATVLADRAAPLLAAFDVARERAEVAAMVTEAAKHGRAVVGREATLDAVARGAVHRLYVLKGLGLVDGLVERVIAAGGEVEFVDRDAELARVGGMAARLRYPRGGAT